jgi:hypothetical protein
MFNDATQVVLMRMGTRTVLSMQNNYKGPPESFAMVVPVPVVLQEKDVKTLNREVFEHVDKMGAAARRVLERIVRARLQRGRLLARPAAPCGWRKARRARRTTSVSRSRRSSSSASIRS